MNRSSKCDTRYSLGEKVWSQAETEGKQLTEKQMATRYSRWESCLKGKGEYVIINYQGCTTNWECFLMEISSIVQVGGGGGG